MQIIKIVQFFGNPDKVHQNFRSLFWCWSIQNFLHRPKTHLKEQYYYYRFIDIKWILHLFLHQFFKSWKIIFKIFDGLIRNYQEIMIHFNIINTKILTSKNTISLTWLNRRVKLTTLGATINLFFLFHEQLVSSSGLMLLKTALSNKVNWVAKSSAGMFMTKVMFWIEELLSFCLGNELVFPVTVFLKKLKNVITIVYLF